MKVVVHILARNEEAMLPYAIRHYKTFAQEITIHDLGSEDRTKEIARSFGAAVIEHDSGGEFRDMVNKTIKNTCWIGTDADWCVVCDCDELMYFPAGPEFTLSIYLGQGVEVVKPIGFEMTAEEFPSGDGQIYDYVKHGAKETDWYSKPNLFCPKRVASLDFGTGAHVVSGAAKDGRSLSVGPRTPANSPSTYLLHFHHLGSVEKIGAKYEAVIARLSAENKMHRWGVQRDGLGHAKEKRAAILKKIERVIP